MSAEFQLRNVDAKINAGLLGGGISSSVVSSITSVLSIKFSEDELAAIMTVLGIVLRAAGLQGLFSFVTLLIQLEQQYVAGVKPPATPVANTSK